MKRKKGFTLAEILIALAIITAILIPVLAILTSGSKEASLDPISYEAYQLLKDWEEQYTGMDYANIPATGAYTDPDKESTIDHNVKFKLQRDIVNTDNCANISLTINWTEQNKGNKTVATKVIRSNYQ
jgi:prepilin-type N-terminal cleavage/methylation domain-containing protein